MSFDPLTAAFGLGEKILDKFFPDPTQKAEAMLKLQELKQSGELAVMANETEILKADIDDRKSARTIHTSFVDWLAVLSLVSSMVILCGILFMGLAAGISDMTAGMIIGMFVGIIPQILNYYFGSSSSSKEKNLTINSALNSLK